MCDPDQTDQERELFDRLRGEAQATRPAFSDALHARICRSLAPQATPRTRRSRSWRARLLVAAAATILVGTTIVASWLGRSPRPKFLLEPGDVASIDTRETVADPDMITATTGDAAQRLGLMVDEALTTGQWAYLDHDARVAVQLLLNQLPFDAESTDTENL